MTTILEGVLPKHIHIYWPHVEKWVDDACSESDGHWTTEALRQELFAGAQRLWVLRRENDIIAAIVCAVEDWDGPRVAVITAAGGSGVIDAMGDHLETIHQWAKANGASRVFMRGRPGFRRVYERHGYRQVAVTMMRDI